MNEKILINITPQEIRVACIEQGKLQELHLERNDARGHIGNIYLGKVKRVLPGMQAAFIDIGLERNAFLHFADIFQPNTLNHKAPKHQAIEHFVFEGQTLMVQVIKDPISTKGARLTTEISIAGRYLVYLPQNSHIGISQKIDNEENREHLKQRLIDLLPVEEQGGYIIRTIADNASDEALVNDIQYLRKTWQKITALSQCTAPINLIYQELSLSKRILRDFVTNLTEVVQINSKIVFEELQAFTEEYIPNLTSKLEYYLGDRPLFDLYNIEQDITSALAQRVNLKSGGYLLIDQTEALTTIDVNTGGYVGLRNFDDTIFKTNLEAVHAIARQLRLRNLGGIIILDFIDMEKATCREAILNELEKALAKDRARTHFSPFSALGLVEMTRKRTSESLSQMLCEPCPTCQGKGIIKTARTVCYDILQEILRESKQFTPKEFCIIASPSVIELMLDEEAKYLSQLTEFIGKPISLKTEAHFSQEQYDIILI